MALIANVKIRPVLGMWPGFGVRSSLRMGGDWHGRDHGRALPCSSPISKWGGEQKFPSVGKKIKVLPPQAGIYSWAVISSLPPSILPSFPSSSPNSKPDLEALSSPAVGAGGLEHLALLSGVLIWCRGRKGSLWVSRTAAQTLSSDIFPALAPPCPGGPMF